jgi:hypothetical protein
MSSRELGPEDWDGRRIRRPLQRASVEARRRSSFNGDSKGDNERKEAGTKVPQPDGSRGNTQRLNAASLNAGGLSGTGGGSNGGGNGGIGSPLQGGNGGGAADERPAGLNSKA